jgi:uncharacterized protein YbjT (DUF2867 family)
MTAWIVGATGLVGRSALGELLAHEQAGDVLAVVRRTTGLTHPRLTEKLVDFEDLERELAGLSADVAICALGSTIKQAGSQAQFRHIDYDYALAFARAALAAGVKHFLLVSALGSDANSAVFYNRVKGELEEALTAMQFAALTILRPSLLIGERTSPRLGESLLGPLSRLLPRSVRGVEAHTVARALVRLAVEPAQGRRIVPSRELHELGG